MTSIFKSLEVFSSSEFTTVQLTSLTYKQQKLKAAISSLSFNFDLYDLLRDIDLFDSSLKHSDSNLRQFNETSNFLRNLQHCQHLYRYRKTHLLLFLFNCLNDSIFKWLQKQSHFDNLHIFSTALTKAFSSQEQRELKSIAQKRAKRKVRKIAERVELKIIETAKQTSKLQSIDIFDSTACDESEFELYNEVANFLQNLQQCQHQYRKSNLLNLLSKCLCDSASEWFKLQSKFTSLKRFNTTLSKAFSSAKTSLRRASSRSSNLQLCTFVAISKSMKNASNQQVVQTICKLCKQNFDFNEKLYEHIRNHEAVKLVKNSHLSINAVNLVWKIKKKSFVTHVSSASSARSQNSIFESASAFKIVTLLKRSSLSSSTLETRSKSTEKSVIELSLFASFDIFNSTRSHQNSEKRRFNQIIIFIQHLQQCQHLYDESELLEWMKVILCDFVDIWFENQSNFIFLHDFDIVLTKTFSERSSFSLSTLKIESKSAKRSATCRHCKQTFKFKKLLRKHKREQHAKKFVINSSLRSHALKSVCKAKKKSTIKNVTTLLASQELQISAQKSQKIDVQKHSAVNSSFTNFTSETIREFVEKSAVTCSSFSQKSSISFATSRNLVTDTKISLQFISFKSSHLSITTLKITSKDTKTTSDLSAENAKIIVDIRAQIAHIRVRIEAERAALQISALESASKSMKRLSIQQIACARICRHCK